MRINYLNHNTAGAKKPKVGELHIEYIGSKTVPSYTMRIHTGDNEFIDVDPKWMKAACEKIQAVEQL